jgi:hypothetical protein
MFLYLQENRVKETAKIINFVLKVAGFERKAESASRPLKDDGVISDDVDLDGLDNEEISELVSISPFM